LSEDRSLEAVSTGVTVLTLRDAVTGLVTTTPIIVEQRVATIDLSPIAFDALGDTIPIQAVPRDRLGSAVGGVALAYSVSDPSVAHTEAGGRLRSVAEGRAVLTARDPESGATASADVVVAQRVASV